MIKPLKNCYHTLVLDHPALTLFVVTMLTAFFGVHVPNFRLDASSDSLSLKNDQAVKYYNTVKTNYGSDEFLIITYTPKKGRVFSNKNLSSLKDLKAQLQNMDRVVKITSILDVPLLNSPPVTLDELSMHTRVLEDPDTDREMAEQELTSSALYKNVLISPDGKTTALLINFQIDTQLEALFQQREYLREKSAEGTLSHTQSHALKAAENAYTKRKNLSQDQWQQDIQDIRDTLVPYQKNADIYIGGVPMIIADSISYIESDLKIFGLVILLFLVVLLTLFFRKFQWVLLPLLVCVYVGVSVIGFLGLVGWPVTIVSSNFISLLLIFTLSFCVHIIVRYRECVQEKPTANQKEVVREAATSIGIPCFYMVFTTMVAFGSLAISDIKPIIDFGWMMTFSLGVAFLIAFTLMPATLMFLPKEQGISTRDMTTRITTYFAKFIQKHSRFVVTGFCTLIFLSIWGLSYLYVQNRFIDYYKKDTDIYQGMVVIDQSLGGTTPMDIIIDAPQDFLAFQEEEQALMAAEGFDVYDTPPLHEGYWLSPLLLEDAQKIHRYLDSLPETGKVLSFNTTKQLLDSLDEAKPLDRFYLGVLFNKAPEEIKDTLFSPYISADGNQLRYSLRIYESIQGLNRQDMLDNIYAHLTTELGLAPEQVTLTGLVVLYNNVLQSLFRSQILTVWVVFIAMFAMFVFLFKNIRIAMIAIVPNITITVFVLGVMGWAGIPLDIMTITIAAICFGIADDNTIHYVHRFRKEFAKHGSYKKAIEHSHTTIGRAMYYTSLTIALGFSILAFSNFVPTIYFGVLTSLSMLVALFANLAFLPSLLLVLKPFGKESNHNPLN